ncbi:UdgX family uracil-DNA binding protein [Anatilimnocola sp. NA78]|uniref:UdgX family uracil-DNA binding protein n=1 Tax=Anatilimnocola sp. NA78 TaxID=3415683 RepID=UPI003CE451F7
MHSISVQHFEDWRTAARALLAAEVPPADIHWDQHHQEQRSLFGADNLPSELLSPTAPSPAARVPPEFLTLAKHVAAHREPQRWEILYRTLWRLTHGERHLLQVTTDGDIYQLTQMNKAIKRDIHKMHAFVRFRKIEVSGEEVFVAWHRPDHRIVRLATPFFARRFSTMTWSILTPDESAHWDQQSLSFGDGVPASEAPQQDALEELWQTYYANIFNPARVNVAQMKKEMPVRHWPTLPESKLIPELLQRAAARVDTMIDTREGPASSAAQFIPASFDLTSLASAAGKCTACDLHCHATQTVFGNGPSNARIVLIGEQPADNEDLAGLPFVGPAGQLLDDALHQAGLPREQVYLTNVVKHFKFTPRGKRRLHQKPDSREVAACLPWLEAELSLLKPATIVCLGSTSAQALFGRDFRLTTGRGQRIRSHFADQALATWHPAAILRMPEPNRRDEMQRQLVHDLMIARN